MKRMAWTIAALVVAQALMFGVWHVVERGRTAGFGPEARPTVAEQQTTRMDRPMPDLELRRPDGSAFRLSETRGRPLVLHFWATWCPPCRDELPALLTYAAEGDVPVLTVSLDRDWQAVRRFLGREPPRALAIARGADIEEAFDVRGLPATFVVNRSGSLRLRMDGPRDWRAPAVRASIDEISR
jgi:thiol-disulfide isomerase/thioredoxin